MDVFMASLRSACSLRRGHFVNNLRGLLVPVIFLHIPL
ncbi:gluconate 5-dehydrogenase [Yersinia pseudotuberculosis]|nr:gluconate 5-dehydrogenase [Yersinia pseudotuberculosis]